MPAQTLANPRAETLVRVSAKLDTQLKQLGERVIWAIIFCAVAGFGVSHVSNTLGNESYYPIVLIPLAFVALLATPAIVFSILAFRTLSEIRETFVKA